MNKLKLLLLPLLAALFLSATQCKALTAGVYVDSWNFNTYTAAQIASGFTISQSVWIDPADSGNRYDTKMGQVQALNPNYKFLVYRNVISVPDYYDTQWDYCRVEGWLLKDASGNNVTEANGWTDLWAADITNSSYQTWVAGVVVDYLTDYPQYAGVYLDNSLKYNADIYNYALNATPVDPVTGNPFSDADVQNGLAAIINAVLTAVGSKIVMVNGVNSGSVYYNDPAAAGYQAILDQTPNLSGISSENTFRGYDTAWLTESAWNESVAFVQEMQGAFLGNTTHYLSVGCPADPLPTGYTEEQTMAFGFASLLLAANYSSPRNSIDFMLDYPTDPALITYAHQLSTTDLGIPTANYTEVSSTHVYERTFTDGLVYVNPTSASYQVTFSGAYQSFDGTPVNSPLTVPAHTGYILVQLEAESPTPTPSGAPQPTLPPEQIPIVYTSGGDELLGSMVGIGAIGVIVFTVLGPFITNIRRHP